MKDKVIFFRCDDNFKKELQKAINHIQSKRKVKVSQSDAIYLALENYLKYLDTIVIPFPND